jgi:hypothetical protein
LGSNYRVWKARVITLESTGQMEWGRAVADLRRDLAKAVQDALAGESREGAGPRESHRNHPGKR